MDGSKRVVDPKDENYKVAALVFKPRCQYRTGPNAWCDPNTEGGEDLKAVIVNFTGGRENWGCQATSYNLYRFSKVVLEPFGLESLKTVAFPPGCLLDIIHRERFGTRIRSVLSDPNAPETDLRWLESLVSSRFGRSADLVRNADLVIFQGEGSIGPSRHFLQTRLFGLPYIAARLWKKTVISLNQTITLHDIADKDVIRNVYTGFSLNAVREPASIEFCSGIGIQDLLICPDMAFCDLFDPAQRKSDSPDYFCATGSSAFETYDMDRYCDTLEEMVSTLKLGLKVLVSRPVDMPLYQQMSRRLGNRVDLVSSRQVPSFQDILGILRNAAFVIGGRYHTSISSLSQMTPVILTPSNSHKSDGVGRLLGIDLPVHSANDRDAMLARSQELILNREKAVEELRGAHARLSRQFEDFARILADFLISRGCIRNSTANSQPIAKAIRNSDVGWTVNRTPRGLSRALSQLSIRRNLAAFNWLPSNGA